MSEIDRVLVKDLEGRYHIGKTALYSRLNALKIVPIKDGKRSYVSAEQLGELDELDRRLKAGGTLPQGTESEMGLANSSVGFVEQLPSLSTEQFLELAQAIALMLRPSDLFSNILPQGVSRPHPLGLAGGELRSGSNGVAQLAARHKP